MIIALFLDSVVVLLRAKFSGYLEPCYSDTTVSKESKGDILGRISTIFEMGSNFCDFLFALLHTKSLQKKGSTLY